MWNSVKKLFRRKEEKKNKNNIDLEFLESVCKNLDWIMRDGTKIKVYKMKESHIQNCINMLFPKWKKEKDERQKKILERWLKIFGIELKRREKLKEKEKVYEQKEQFRGMCEDFLAEDFLMEEADFGLEFGDN